MSYTVKELLNEVYDFKAEQTAKYEKESSEAEKLSKKANSSNLADDHLAARIMHARAAQAAVYSDNSAKAENHIQSIRNHAKAEYILRDVTANVDTSKAEKNGTKYAHKKAMKSHEAAYNARVAMEPHGQRSEEAEKHFSAASHHYYRS